MKNSIRKQGSFWRFLQFVGVMASLAGVGVTMAGSGIGVAMIVGGGALAILARLMNWLVNG